MNAQFQQYSPAQLNSFEASLHRASSLVDRWGSAAPLGRPSIRQVLTVEGLSLWDVLAVDLALYIVPDGLAEQTGSKTMRQRLAPYLRQLKYRLAKSPRLDTRDCVRWPQGKTALFLGYTAYLARDVLQPVVDLLQREGGLSPVMLSAIEPAADAPNSIHCTQRHRTLQVIDYASQFGKLARRAGSIVTGERGYTELFREGSACVWPLVKQGVRRAINISAGFILPDSIAVARHILEVHRPAVIVSIDVADPRTRIYSLLGAALGIPTVQVQSGAVGQEAVEWRFLHDDIVATQGSLAQAVLESQAVPSKKITITGSPRYDGLHVAAPDAVKSFRERFAIPEGNRVVLLASTYALEAWENNLAQNYHLSRAMKSAVFAAVAAVPGVSLVVKPHPLEDVAETLSLVKDHARIAFADPKEDIRELAKACDAFVSFGSTATLDALILGKPTICPAFPGWVISDVFTKTGAVAVPRSEHDLVEIFRNIESDGGDAILRRHAEPRALYLSSVVRDGGKGATRRIAQLLKSLAGVEE